MYKVTTRDRKSCMLHWSQDLSRLYLQGSIVEARPGSLGIFIFDTIENARSFANLDYQIILKVKPIGIQTKPSKIASSHSSENIKDFYYNKSIALTSLPPQGTVCCSAVEVLE